MIPTQQAREKGVPWINISVYDSHTLVLNLNKLGFQPSKQGRQEVPRLIS